MSHSLVRLNKASLNQGKSHTKEAEFLCDYRSIDGIKEERMGRHEIFETIERGELELNVRGAYAEGKG